METPKLGRGGAGLPEDTQHCNNTDQRSQGLAAPVLTVKRAWARQGGEDPLQGLRKARSARQSP